MQTYAKRKTEARVFLSTIQNRGSWLQNRNLILPIKIWYRSISKLDEISCHKQSWTKQMSNTGYANKERKEYKGSMIASVWRYFIASETDNDWENIGVNTPILREL
jgi:hypothetical protein